MYFRSKEILIVYVPFGSKHLKIRNVIFYLFQRPHAWYSRYSYMWYMYSNDVCHQHVYVINGTADLFCWCRIISLFIIFAFFMFYKSVTMFLFLLFSPSFGPHIPPVVLDLYRYPPPRPRGLCKK